MIIKHIPIRAQATSNIVALVRYITGTQGKTERLGLVRTTNCEAVGIDDTILEMLATQRMNVRARSDKTYHLLISFRVGEEPTPAVLAVIEKRVCDSLGYAEHQRVSAVHTDTDNVHVHIAINKIHPKTLRLKDPYQAYRTFAKLAPELEQEFGLAHDNHQPTRTVNEGRAGDMEAHSGIESLVSWIRKECLTDIQSAKSWSDLHDVLTRHGLEVKERGNGLVFVSGSGIAVKASTVARELSKAKLENKLGTFESKQADTQEKTVTPVTSTAPKTSVPQPKPEKTYTYQPIKHRVSTDGLWKRYQAERCKIAAEKPASRDNLRRLRDAKIEAAKDEYKTRKLIIRNTDNNHQAKRVLHGLSIKKLKSEIEQINQEYREQLGRVHKTYPKTTWADWLRSEAQRGDREALEAIRARLCFLEPRGSGITGSTPTPARAGDRFDSITKKGTIIYRVGTTAIRDEGSKLRVSKDTTGEQLQRALEIAIARYGRCLTISGTAQFKAKVIRAAVNGKIEVNFSDNEMEQAKLNYQKAYHEQNDQRSPGRASVRAAVKSDGRIDTRKTTAGRRQNGLRDLSQLDVVQDQRRAEVLLSSDARHSVGFDKDKINPDVRRSRSR